MNLNNLDEAIETLMAFATKHRDSDINNRLILLSVRWHDLKKGNQKGTLSTTDEDLTRAKIRAALLDIATELEKEYGEIPETKNNKQSSKNQTDMLAETLFSGLLSTYESGGAEFLKSVGTDFAKGLATDTLKKLGDKVVGFFKVTKEKPQIDSLELAILKKDKDSFKEQSASVLELIKAAVETDTDFAKEVKAIIDGLDDKTQKELAETSTKNVANITGNNNNVFQGIHNSKIHIGDKIKRQINVKGDYFEKKGDE